MHFVLEMHQYLQAAETVHKTSINLKEDKSQYGYELCAGRKEEWKIALFVVRLVSIGDLLLEVSYKLVNLTLDLFRDTFVSYWIDSNMMTMDIATQIFTILKQPDRKYLTQVSSKFQGKNYFCNYDHTSNLFCLICN